MTSESKLSVVVASHNARESIGECLSSLLRQEASSAAEIVVVDNSTDGTAEIIRERFPTVRLLSMAQSALIPELWGAGIRASAADIVAITTAHCVPKEDWIGRIIQAHEAPFPAIGGAIENSEDATLVDWAIYFCRYSSYMLPFPQGFVSEIPGDNASYKRAAIDRCRHAWRDGFWEPTVHAELRKEGSQLLLMPSIVVCHKRSFGFWGFMKQRFQHGRKFGGWRASTLAGPKRALLIGLSPATSLLLLVRITRQVLTKRRHRRELLISLPILALFLSAWALGELTGYLRGANP